MDKIQFGTDGWRAIIAKQFTFANVSRIAQAISDYLHTQTKSSAGVALGFDTRFQSPDFARTVAEILAANRIPVYLSKNYSTTPMLSFTVKEHRLAVGIMITASHNPYTYSGIKIKGPYGGSASSEMMQTIADLISATPPRINSQTTQEYIYPTDFFIPYHDHLRNYVNFDLINNLSQTVIFNPMHGAGCDHLQPFLQKTPIKLISINNSPDPLFGGKLPEPVMKNLSDHRQAVLDYSNSIGVATDGDGDRFGVIDEQGEFVQLHELMPLLFRHLVETRNWRGMAVRSISMATTIDRVAREYGRQCLETPVGFKHICQKMLSQDVLLGGEESGGFGYKNHIPERDGILSILLLLEMLGRQQTPLHTVIQELRAKYGDFYYDRIDKYCAPARLKQNMQRLQKQPPQKIGDYTVERISTIDGIKFYFSEGSWMLMRISQTEPLGRVYVGSNRPQKVNHILEQGILLLTT